MAGQNDDYEKQARKRYEAAVKRMQEDLQKKEFARRILDDGAYERLMNVKLSNAELYEQVLSMLVSFVQSRRMAGKVSEKELVALLQRVTERHEPTISFRHK